MPVPGGRLHLFHAVFCCSSSERSICADLHPGSNILYFVYVAGLSLSLQLESSTLFYCYFHSLVS